ncbi:MAG: hypothetical protein IKK43_02000 [Clostridia bacterium]|nr:hypothetical protein [Clostridia bacterium]
MNRILLKISVSILIMLLLFTTLTGCYNSKELDDLAYIIGIAIDKGTEKKFMITLQIAVPVKIASEGSEPGKDSSTLITIEADSLSSAISYASTRTSKEMKLSHNKIIVFSEEIAKTELTNCVNAFISSQEIRPRTSIVVCPDEARKFLENAFPVLETNPARYYDLLLASAEYTGYTTKTELIDFYLNNKSKYINPIAIHGNITTYQDPTGPSDPNPPSAASDSSSGNDSQGSSSESGGNSNGGGGSSNDSSSSGGSSSGSSSGAQDSNQEQNKEDLTPELYGIAVFANNVMVGTLTNYEVLAHSIMTNSLQGVNFDLGETTVSISQRKRPQIKVNVDGNIPHIDITVLLDARLLYSGDNLNYLQGNNKKDLQQKLEEEFKNIITTYLDKTAKEFKSDIVGFGKILKANYLTIEELDKINWLNIYKNSVFDLKVKFNVDTAQIFSSNEELNTK